MVKTTIALEDALYRKLVKEAIDRYGKTRCLSRLVNEKLKFVELQRTEPMSERIKGGFGCWKMNETGADYVTKLRKQSERRLRRVGI